MTIYIDDDYQNERPLQFQQEPEYNLIWPNK